MRRIPARQIATLQTAVVARNAIGEQVETWEDALTLRGVLDMSSGGTNYTSFNAKIMESTHVFLCDYVRAETGAESAKIGVAAIGSFEIDAVRQICATESRFVVDGAAYDVTMIDDPCGLHDHLEIYLQYRGVA